MKPESKSISLTILGCFSPYFKEEGEQYYIADCLIKDCVLMDFVADENLFNQINRIRCEHGPLTSILLTASELKNKILMKVEPILEENPKSSEEPNER